MTALNTVTMSTVDIQYKAAFDAGDVSITILLK